jgi:hypothetical protein
VPKNKLSDLRNHLFETIERLKDEENPMPVDRAKTISDVAQTIINSAKVELRAIELAGGDVQSSEFLELEEGGAEHLLPDPRDRKQPKGLSTGKDFGRAS